MVTSLILYVTIHCSVIFLDTLGKAVPSGAEKWDSSEQYFEILTKELIP